ncbi:hypothetical protein B7C51_24840 (plasmid) [Paenibacillus larvae subsp. pulvifaciens]|uniref:Uncharacterized protein n=1 Tax=Paenibacillus larvae subsp. pulvifaciens TaxID=1477 RepID=A0A1V0UZT1_9BACL|nr:hypothetical protein [Paenibacillus larvae]ARF70704.1 hypothetical protein B7C51_24840 [Paenibacillus larvae subsp. pulvifaciens]
MKNKKKSDLFMQSLYSIQNSLGQQLDEARERGTPDHIESLEKVNNVVQKLISETENHHGRHRKNCTRSHQVHGGFWIEDGVVGKKG